MSEITKIRKNLHQNPELSGKEFKTSKTIAAFLKNHNPDDLLENLGSGTGIIAVYHPQFEIKKTVMFRCELDALPIQEINDFEHRSAVDGISHKCGHDGHMSILCNFAKKLSLQKMKHTKILLLFQPSEENGGGALSIFNDARFKTFNLDLVFALHNLPGFPHHEIVVKNNTFSCAVHSIIIKLFGRTAHAGEPHNGENPALAISEIITAFNKKSQPDHQKDNFTILTPIYINMGTEDYGISAGYGEVHYTIRRAANSEMRALEKELEEVAKTTAHQFNLTAEISWTQKFSANENDPAAVNLVRQAAKSCNFNLTERKVPFSWGEDFGVFTENYPGAMFGLGSGLSTPNLHNPDYDWPDEITETGTEIFYKISQIIDAQ